MRKASNIIREKMEIYEKTNSPISMDIVGAHALLYRALYREILDLICLFYVENISQFGKSRLSFRDYKDFIILNSANGENKTRN